jgi:DNA polymerase III subunit epsilon
MKWLLDGPIGCFDVESTGLDVETDRVVTACVGVLNPGSPWVTKAESWLLNPGVDISTEATKVHGVTNETAWADGDRPEVALDQIGYELATMMMTWTPVVVMNGAYDFTILDRELRRYDLLTLEERLNRPVGPVVDIYVIDKWLDPFRSGRRKLVDLCTHYGVRIDGAHDSTFDATAAARVGWRMASMTQWEPTRLLEFFGSRRRPSEVADRFVEVGALSSKELHARQVGWRVEQQDSLREYFVSHGASADDVDDEWPMRRWKGTP